MLVLGIAIKLDSKGPIFYKQERITTNNRKFKIYKFRTMVQNADKIGSLVTVGNDNNKHYEETMNDQDVIKNHINDIKEGIDKFI